MHHSRPGRRSCPSLHGMRLWWLSAAPSCSSAFRLAFSDLHERVLRVDSELLGYVPLLTTDSKVAHYLGTALSSWRIL